MQCNFLQILQYSIELLLVHVTPSNESQAIYLPVKYVNYFVISNLIFVLLSTQVYSFAKRNKYSNL